MHAWIPMSRRCVLCSICHGSVTLLLLTNPDQRMKVDKWLVQVHPLYWPLSKPKQDPVHTSYPCLISYPIHYRNQYLCGPFFYIWTSSETNDLSVLIIPPLFFYWFKLIILSKSPTRLGVAGYVQTSQGQGSTHACRRTRTWRVWPPLTTRQPALSSSARIRNPAHSGKRCGRVTIAATKPKAAKIQGRSKKKH